ncbi:MULTISPECIES: LacI family DNA-binding transcriptional regulator [Pseudomonas]|uniref:LacI family DNA-binding transcriptional regulator n=2 Tax=Pseudomonas TaxID=286 RepID=A0A7Z3BKL2_9PSED|nr:MULTISPECIES: LacI family DNA-binding transcriptional regulator [Pseudomonas]QJP08637.1 LacI family DNA-binding transcriptional regulator [Pseudomonas multiresinivorans]TLX71081.1 LacI family DNA-binding transcriptional regulator [Pseudomonas nicosulfuronedens]
MSRVTPPPSATTRTTAKDLAVRLGVATSTITRAFDEHSRISPELRGRILAIADELGYRPNAIARSLNRRKTGIVALVIGSLGNPFYPALLETFALRLRQEGRQLLMFVVPPGGDADQSMPQLLQYQVDAIVVTAAKLSSRMSELCAQQGIAVVFLNRRVEDPSVWSVCCDNQRMGREVAVYLAGSGRRACAFVSGDPGISTTTDRLYGFKQGLAEHGQQLVACIAGGYTYDGARQAAGQLFSKTAPAIDAVFCANDVMALGVLAHVRQNTSLRVPEDVALVGFDDIRDAAYPEHSLTTVHQPLDRMIDCAIELLGTGRPNGSLTDALREVPGRLVLRSSA